MLPTRTDVFAEYLSDAYSTGSYRGGWGPSIKMLRRRGYNDHQIEAIIRSKWTRWAEGKARNPNRMTSADLARFLDRMTNLEGELDALVRETSPDIYDPLSEEQHLKLLQIQNEAFLKRMENVK